MNEDTIWQIAQAIIVLAASFILIGLVGWYRINFG